MDQVTGSEAAYAVTQVIARALQPGAHLEIADELRKVID